MQLCFCNYSIYIKSFDLHTTLFLHKCTVFAHYPPTPHLSLPHPVCPFFTLAAPCCIGPHRVNTLLLMITSHFFRYIFQVKICLQNCLNFSSHKGVGNIPQILVCIDMMASHTCCRCVSCMMRVSHSTTSQGALLD